MKNQSYQIVINMEEVRDKLKMGHAKMGKMSE